MSGFFFFSSRRRHTRYWRDWSSDVCSSDLGFRFLLYFIGEFANAGVFGALAAVLFVGGWWVPGIDPDSNVFNVLGPLVMFVKLMVFMLVVFWVRFTYPRLREDQLQKLAWKVLIPVTLANIAVTAILKVAF